MGFRVGVDIGGTFTDLCALDERSGELHTMKVFSRPDAPGSDVVEGLRMLEERYGITPGDITRFTHGTTVGINAIIMRKGIRLGLVTTEGFGDVLELARLKMPDPYSILSRRPEPLIPRDMTIGFPERVRADGTVELAPTEDAMAEVLRQAREKGVEGLVVALLHSYRNPAHERALRDYARRHAPGIPVFCSADIWPIVREYERTTTAVLHGYVQPRISDYISALQRELKAVGVRVEPMLTTSTGGLMTAEAGKTACEQMLLSGTASGVVGASLIAARAGFEQVLSVDIGGTSADVAVITNGQPSYGTGEMIGDFPIFIPSVAVMSIGGGGGSIARLDAHGMLRVGPESAGSTPGPACFGRGGLEATVTDALATCGFLGLADLGYNRVSLDRAKSAAALDPIAKGLGCSTQEAGEAVIKVAVSDMQVEISKLMSREGLDPRDVALMAFGGAGPMLTAFLARELGVARVIVPRTPGVLAALGGLVSDVRNDFVSTFYADLDDTLAERIDAEFARLEAEARRWLLDDQGFDGEEVVVRRSADMRYRGQSFEIAVALSDGASPSVQALAEAFHARHQGLFDYHDRASAVQVIALRLTISGIVPKPVLPQREMREHEAAPAGRAPVFLDGAVRDVPLFNRADLTPGARFLSPAVVLQDDTTVCIPPGMRASVDRQFNLILTRETAQ